MCDGKGSCVRCDDSTRDEARAAAEAAEFEPASGSVVPAGAGGLMRPGVHGVVDAGDPRGRAHDAGGVRLGFRFSDGRGGSGGAERAVAKNCSVKLGVFFLGVSALLVPEL